MPSAGSSCLWKLSHHCGDTSSSSWLQTIPLSTNSCRESLEVGMQEGNGCVGLLSSCTRTESRQSVEQAWTLLVPPGAGGRSRARVSDVCLSL